MVSSGQAFVAPETAAQARVADCLADVLEIEQVSIDDHIFEHLGLDSLGAAAFVSVLSAQWPECKASIADVHMVPTVRQLAETLEAETSEPAPDLIAAPAYVASNLSHVVCGILQAATYIALATGYLWLAMTGFLWIAAVEDMAAIATRSALFVVALFGLFVAVPIAAKWSLIGRWQAGKIPLWSLSCFRFWLVRTLVESSPLAAMRGSPVFNLYLRLLGARIGDNAVLLCKSFPLCTDLISIGRNTVVRKHAYLTGYRAEAGYMRLGRVQIGNEATIGAVHCEVVSPGVSLNEFGGKWVVRLSKV